MTEAKKLPGGPLRMRPVEVDGTFYDPYHPPKLYQTADGKQEYRGGKVIDRDEAYSMMFWSRPIGPGLRESMMESIETAAQSGQFFSFAGVSKISGGKIELDQKSKEKLSAYRILAKEMGYVIGSFQYHEDAGTVQASITKIPVSNNPTK